MNAARPPLLDRIAAAADGEESRLLLVTGGPGAGKTYLVAQALSDLDSVHFVCPGLTDPEHRRLFVQELAGMAPERPEPDAEWADIFAWVERSPIRALAFDGLGALTKSSRKFLEILGRSWQAQVRRGRPLLLILIDRDRRVLEAVNAKASPFRDPLQTVTGTASDPGIWIEPRTSLLAGGGAIHAGSGAERLLGAALFGGRPRVLRRLDPRITVAANYRDAVLDPLGALFDEPLTTLAKSVQHPGRYGRLLRALAIGIRSWDGLRAAVDDGSGGSSPTGPYVKRLIELGRVVAEHPLDADQRGRGRRYRLRDPFEMLWWRSVVSRRSGLSTASLTPDAAWEEIRTAEISAHMEQVFPWLCRDYLLDGSDAVLGSRARETGALWGDGFDIPVAARLHSGPVVYGACHTGPGPMRSDALDGLTEQMRNTRFGFGREARIRVLFSLSGFDDELIHMAARDPLVRLVGIDELTGAEVQRPAGAP